jgi:hypothetical protein
MNDNVRVLGAAFLPEGKLREEIREVVRQYNGRISYAQLLGILEILKFEYMQDGYIGEE